MVSAFVLWLGLQQRQDTKRDPASLKDGQMDGRMVKRTVDGVSIAS